MIGQDSVIWEDLNQIYYYLLFLFLNFLLFLWLFLLFAKCDERIRGPSSTLAKTVKFLCLHLIINTSEKRGNCIMRIILNLL